MPDDDDPFLFEADDPLTLPAAGGSSAARGGARVPAPVGAGDAVPLQTVVTRTVTAVDVDWRPPQPNTRPLITVRGTTIEALLRALEPIGEWGRGGGGVRAQAIPPGTSPAVTVHLHARLELRLPAWNATDRDRATAPVRAEWDRMIASLRVHEQRHLDLALEAFDRLAADLIGMEIEQVADRVTQANREAADAQAALDDATDHGSRSGVPYGDVYLDANADGGGASE